MSRHEKCCGGTVKDDMKNIAKESTLHMIGNAHIDPVWLWRWQEGFHEVRGVFPLGAGQAKRVRRLFVRLEFRRVLSVG